jgi:hypothetical protein
MAAAVTDRAPFRIAPPLRSPPAKWAVLTLSGLTVAICAIALARDPVEEDREESSTLTEMQEILDIPRNP